VYGTRTPGQSPTSTDITAHVDHQRLFRNADLRINLNVNVPHGLEVVQVDPTQFQLAFDYRMTRSVEVRPRVTGISPQACRCPDIADRRES